MIKLIGLHTKYMEFTQNITNEVVTKYINRFYQPLTPALGALRQEAEQAEVPIILKETEQYLKTMLAVVKPQRILEIGCARRLFRDVFRGVLRRGGRDHRERPGDL